ncbi:hypothetical protein [Actinokineospora enzanensis]|uniref:WDGH domain-containing protein n=1 Tax=Actinokineospora enzanensis TaxID=155975 RepID=UPI000362EA64|nr:hypothetical protein [Actinokineospora enzanensis]
MNDASIRELYRDRAHVVALLAAMYPAHIETDPAPPAPEVAMVVVIDTITGQLSWHVHRDDMDLFGWLPRRAREWDGHDAATRHERIHREIARLDLHEEGALFSAYLDGFADGCVDTAGAGSAGGPR